MEMTEQNQPEQVPPLDARENEQDKGAARGPGFEKPEETARSEEEVIIHNVPHTPPTAEENARRYGLAWSAGVVFVGSVAFMLFLGWIADLLLGSSPWGIVGGIVLGSIIGFIQFFRISSQIFEKPAASGSSKTLFKEDDKDR